MRGSQSVALNGEKRGLNGEKRGSNGDMGWGYLYAAGQQKRIYFAYGRMLNKAQLVVECGP